ncbi:nitrilase-related carbon-nitrogen hydrolase [Arthrobacter mobilis]|uniref:Nitrilase n=1 Tax=Arthrobacter mobilis TaxID=2724944 RepID=A0A7X6HGB7_9MICC|nr:nitrilase-related carbon-nitrogen hydrolase [Arthrobacter mobilis]NKX55157.1 nitrilase [Arthrobacter mobilis]
MRIAAMQAAGKVLDIEENLALVETAAARAARAGADLLLTPELFACGYAPAVLASHLDAELVRRIDDGAARIARRHRLGLAYSVPSPAPGGWHIGAVLVDRSGRELLRYGKVHLFGDEERATFVPASAAPGTAVFEGLRVGLLICYDAEFPESVRALAAAGADLALVPTALGTGFEAVPEVLLRARALESQVALAYANHTGSAPAAGGGTLEFGGGSIIIGPDGSVLAQAGSGGPGPDVIIADVQPAAIGQARSAVPYLKDRRPDLYPSWGAAAADTPAG